MSSLRKHSCRKLLTLAFAILLLTNVFWLAMTIKPVLASPDLTLKWRVKIAQTHIGALAADLVGDDKLEIIVTGIGIDGNGTVAVLDGTTGSLVWERTPVLTHTHSPFDVVDLNKDAIPEIVVSAWYPLVLHGNNGSTYWENQGCKAYQNYNAICDIDGDGYPEVFVSSGSGPKGGYDYITRLSYDGYIQDQAWCWHPCWGGVSIGDANFDGRFELYQGDRSNSYNPSGDPYKYGGMGVRALDAHTLKPLWNDPTILCSSQAPMLADVDKDGILDVIVNMQTSEGIAVLNSADGSVVTTGGIYRKGRIATPCPSHSQPTVYDIDYDGNLEFIDCAFAGSNPKIWDLYDWKLDATLDVICTEPPKIGDVTGDGKMDIIAVTDHEIYVYSYVGGTYTLVDYTSEGLSWGTNDFTLLQDVDGDNLNELVLTSMSGYVYCYDTPAPAPTPRARSNLQFYSEYKLGAAEYVSPPSRTRASRPSLTDEQPADNSQNQMLNPTLSIDATDYQGNKMDITLSFLNASEIWEDIASYTNIGNGVYTATTSDMDSYGTTYYWSVNATDTVTGNWTYRTYSFTTYSRAPTHVQPILVSSGGTNGYKEDLICSNQTTTDPDGDEVTNIYSWYVNDSSLTNLLLPFDTRPETGVHTLLTDGFEDDFDNWDGNGYTAWDRTDAQKHSGLYSAHASGASESDLISDDLDVSAAETIVVSFWYRAEGGINIWDYVHLQFWDGSNYRTIFNIGFNNPDEEWRHYSIWYRTLFSYQIPDFHIRFRATEISNPGEHFWIDDVSISVICEGASRAKDYSGYNNHGAVRGAAWTSEGVVGGAYIFDGDDRIRVAERDASLGGDGTWSEISVEFWVKATTNTGTERLIWKHAPDSTSTIGYRIDFRARSSRNELTWRIYTPSSSYSILYYITSGARSWHHVICTYESGVGLKIYVDGTERESSSPYVGNIRATANGPLEIGYYSGSGDFGGILDEVRIYPKALSPFQISQRYLETKDGLTNNSTMAWQETEIGDLWKCQVTPNDGFGDGESKFSNTLLIHEDGNVPPVAGNLTITPLSPTTTDDLTASYDYFDADGDPEYGSEIMWYMEGVLQPDLNNSPTVSSSLTAKGQEWYYTVRPKDFIEFGDLQTSSNITILNSPPSFTDMYITPDPAFNTSTLTANPYGWSDDDDDSEGYFYQWQILDGSWQDIVGETSQTLSPDSFDRGDTVRVNCTAFDGEINGTSHVDMAWIVDSDPPTHDDPLLVSSHGTNMTDEELICYNQTTTDPDGDEVTNIYHWIQDGDSLTTLLMPFETNSSVTAWDYSGYGNDGTVYGATWTSDGIVGGAYEFDGDDVIEITDDSSLGGNDDWYEISVEFWVRPSALVRGTRIISRARPGETGSYMIGFQTNAPDPYNTLFWGVDSVTEGWVDISDSPDWDPVNDGLVLEVGKWYHVFCTYQSGPGLTIYVNGLERFNMPLTGYIDSRSGQTLFLGYDGGGSWYRYLQGTLDEVRIYPMALTAAQAFQRYIETKDGFSNNSTIVPQETTAGEVWSCEVIPNDSWQDGTAKTSNPLTVLAVTGNSRPRIDLYTPTETMPEVNEGESLVFTHESSDSDGDPLTYSWLQDGVEQATAQNWTFMLGYEDAGTYNITLIISDGELTDFQEWNVTVNEVTDPPTIDSYYPLGDPTISEGESQLFNVTYSDPDLDPISVQWLLNGSLVGSNDNYTFVADYTSAGVYNVTVVISDGFAQDSHEWNLTVLEVTDPPVIDSYYPLSDPTISEEESQLFNVTYSDPDGDSVSAQWYLDGTPTVDTDNYTFTADYESAGTYNVTVVVSDGLAETSHEWMLIVINVNRHPVIVSYTPTDLEPPVNEGDSLNFTHTSSDPDDDTLTYSWILDSIEQAATQNWTYSPGYEDAGFHNVTLIVSDDELFTSQEWNVSVLDINGPPIIDDYYPLGDPTIGEGESQEFNVTYHDPDLDSILVEWLLNGSLVGSEDNYTFVAGYVSAGVYNVTVVISDPGGLFDSQRWNLTVLETYALTINVFGDGSVTKVPDRLNYTYGTEVNLTAVADVGWSFGEWSGDLTGGENPTSIVMDGNKTINATFIQEEYTLTVNVFGNGTVTRVPDQLNYTYGVEVNLTAIPDEGWLFLGWSGDLNGSVNPESIFMDGNKTVDATFIEESFSDDFDDDSTDLVYWKPLEKNNGTVSEVNGRVECLVETTPPSGTAGYITVRSYDLSDCDIRIEVSNQYLCEAALAITLDGIEDHFWYSTDFYAIEKNLWSNSCYVQKRLDNGTRIVLYNETWTGPTGYLRIRIQDGVIYFYEEDNLRYSEPFELSSYNCYIHFEANTWGDGYCGMDYFDNFEFRTPYVNVPPVIDSYYPATNPTIFEGESQEFNVTYYDPNGDPVTTQWYLNGTPTATTDNYTFTADYESDGTYNVSVIVSDGMNQTCHEWTLTVNDVNRAPTIDSYTPTIPEPTVDEGASLNFTHTSSDPDNDTLAYSWLLDSVEQAVTQNWTYTPGYEDSGTYNVTLIVSDGELTDSRQWNLTVLEVTDPPVIDSYYPLSDPAITEEESQLFNVTYHDPDDDAVLVQWYLNGTPTVDTDNYTFTADYDSAGVYNVTVVISDGLAETSHEWTLTVLNVNRPPEIDSYTPEDLEPEVDEGSSLNFNHTSSDPDNDTLTYSWLLNGTEQAFTQNWTYTPAYGDARTENITLVVTDPGGLFDSQQWNVTVNNVNDPPIIDSFYPLSDPTILENKTQEFNVTYSDPDGPSVTVQWYLNGTPAGSLDNYTYTADYDSAGTYNVTAVLSDGYEQTSHEWTLEVLNVNRPPTIDSYTPLDPEPTVDEASSLSFNHTSSDPDGDSLDYSWLLDDVQQATSQNWTYSPGYEDAGTHNITLIVSDGDLFAFQEWNVTVNNVNRYPTIDSYTPLDEEPDVDEESSLNFNHTSSDPDGDSLDYSWLLDDVQQATTQNWTYYPGYEDSGTHNVTLVVSDPGGLFASQEWNVTVNNVNRHPEIDSYTPLDEEPEVDEGSSLNFTHISSDPDGDSLTYSWLLNGVEQATTQNWTYTPAYGDARTENVTLVVNDPGGLFDSQQWNVTVNNINDPPTIDSFYPLSDPTINETESQEFNVTYSDPDGPSVTVQWYLNGTPVGSLDNYTYTADYDSAGTYNVTVVLSDSYEQTIHEWTLTVQNVNRYPTIDSYTPSDDEPEVDEGSSLNFTHTSSDPDGDPLTYSWLLDDVEQATSQNWTYAPGYESAGTHNVTLIVSDGDLFDSQQWNLTVNDVNGPPVIDTYYPLSDPTIFEDESQEFNITYHDPDPDVLTVEWYLNGSLAGADDSYIFNADYDSAGLYNVTVVVSDGSKKTSHEWALTVINVNRPPTIDSYTPLDEEPTVDEASSLSFNHTSYDPDGDSLTYSWLLDDVQQATSQNWTYSPGYEDAGTHNVTLVVSDPGGLFASQEWNVTVNNVNRHPEIDSYTPLDEEPEVDEGSSLNFTHISSDPDGDSLNYSWLLDGVEQAVTQNWTYSPGYEDAGVHNVTLVVSDGELTDFQQWNVTVNDVNRSPIIDDHYPSANPTINEGESQLFNVTYHDPDGDLLTVQWYLNGSVVGSDDNYTFVAGYEDAGVHNVTVVVSDPDGLFDLQQWNLTVLETYTLTINVFGNGTVTKDPDQLNYTYGAEVNLTAVADLGWSFIEWSGDLTGSENPATIVMDGDKVVNATFLQGPYTLTINVFGNGSVSRNATDPYYYGDVVELTAVPDVGWNFSGWSEDLSGSANPETLLIDADKVVNATFTQEEYTLTVNVFGNGSVSLNVTGPYYYGDAVELNATADADWMFLEWTGDLTGSLNPDTIVMDGDKTVNATFMRVRAQFDFGTPTSPVEAGYTQITTSTLYTAGSGYGWTSTTDLHSRDRTSPDNLRRDFVFSSTENTFNVDLANGDYQVNITIGDQDCMHDMIDVYAENTLVINDLTAAAGSFQQVTFTATVADGQLNLRILDDGGTDLNWVITALTIQPGAPPPPTEASFDFGTSTSPVEAGYTQITTSTLYTASLGYGWNSTAGLHARDRGAPDNLRRDFVFSSTENTFNVDLANGDYQVNITIGDQDFMHDMIDVYAEGNLVINDLTAAAGSFQEVTFGMTVTDGQLNLRILDDGGADSNWVITALTIQPGAPPPPTEASFDFGTSTSPVEAGYTQITTSTLYTASVGYGWTSTTGLHSRDRTSPDNLRRDFVFSSTESTFNVDLANGDYQVNITIGDQDFMHDMIDVYAEDILVINDLTAAAGSFQQVTFTATVADGQLNLRILDDGGTDSNWVLSALTIVIAPP